MSTRETKKCPNCGINFWHGRRDKIFCNRSCKTSYRQKERYRTDLEYRQRKLEINNEYYYENKER